MSVPILQQFLFRLKNHFTVNRSVQCIRKHQITSNIVKFSKIVLAGNYNKTNNLIMNWLSVTHYVYMIPYTTNANIYFFKYTTVKYSKLLYKI